MLSIPNSQDGFHHDTACVRIISTKARATKKTEIDTASFVPFECSEFCPCWCAFAFKREILILSGNFFLLNFGAAVGNRAVRDTRKSYKILGWEC